MKALKSSIYLIRSMKVSLYENGMKASFRGKWHESIITQRIVRKLHSMGRGSMKASFRKKKRETFVS
jgi:hypothetical protein